MFDIYRCCCFGVEVEQSDRLDVHAGHIADDVRDRAHLVLHDRLAGRLLLAAVLQEDPAQVQAHLDAHDHTQLCALSGLQLGAARLLQDTRPHALRPTRPLRRPALARQRQHHTRLQLRVRHRHRPLSHQQVHGHRALRALQPRAHTLSPRAHQRRSFNVQLQSPEESSQQSLSHQQCDDDEPSDGKHSRRQRAHRRPNATQQVQRVKPREEEGEEEKSC